MIKILMFCFLTTSSFAQLQQKIEIVNFDDSQQHKQILRSVQSIVSAVVDANINGGNPEKDEVYLTTEATAILAKLWKSEPFTFNEDVQKIEIFRNYKNQFMVRGFNIKPISREDNFAVDIVLLFDSTAVMEDIYFGAKLTQYKTNLLRAMNPNDVHRWMLCIETIERLKTAFYCGDSLYLYKFLGKAELVIDKNHRKSVSDKKFTTGDSVGLASVSKVDSIEYDIQKELKRIYQNGGKTKIHLLADSYHQHRKIFNLFGVTTELRMTNKSWTLDGYISLLLDLQDKNSPILHIVAWQPKAVTKPEQVLSIYDFEIIE